MKFFVKTFIIFLCLILFQAVLTAFIVTKYIQNANESDSATELVSETEDIYHGLITWKRLLWEKLIIIKKEATILHTPSYEATRSLIDRIEGESGIDGYAFFKETNSNLSSIRGKGFILTSLPERLKEYSSFPKIRYIMLQNKLYLTGTIFFPIGDESYGCILFKEISGDLCTSLTYQRRSKIAFFVDSIYTTGTFEPALMEDTALFRERDTQMFYTTANTTLGDRSFSVAMQKLEDVINTDKSCISPLILTVLLSNEPYIGRLQTLKDTLMYVSIFCVFLTAAISLFLSNNITRPVKSLSAAMENIRMGKYLTVSSYNGSQEIKGLVSGFNSMARTLEEDRINMDNYINEILLLKEYNEKIIHSIKTGIAIINNQYEIEKTNPQFDHFFSGHPEIGSGFTLTHRSTDILDQGISANITQIIRGEKKQYSVIKRRDSGKVFDLKLYPFKSSPISDEPIAGCVLMIDDITQKVLLDEKIYQAEKLSSLSLLSAGISHEINNPLSSIMTNVQNMISETEDPYFLENLNLVESETRRIARIVRELLDFASPDQKSDSGSDVGSITSEVIQLINNYMRKSKNISITTEIGPLPPARISGDELKQILINLLNNAVHALHENGKINISAEYLGHLSQICLTVSDNGCGIAEDIIPHIFDPFYSSRKDGTGTGLGLSIVYGLITKYGGNVKVTSTPGKGTTFILYIPILSGEKEINNVS